MTEVKKKAKGRSSKLVWPESIDASPEEIADVVMRAQRPKEWEYLKKDKKG